MLWVLLNGKDYSCTRESRDKGLGFGFVPVIACSDPVRLEEGVNLWGLTILGTIFSFPLLYSCLKARNREKITPLSVFFSWQHLGTPKSSTFSLKWVIPSCQQTELDYDLVPSDPSARQSRTLSQGVRKIQALHPSARSGVRCKPKTQV